MAKKRKEYIPIEDIPTSYGPMKKIIALEEEARRAKQSHLNKAHQVVRKMDAIIGTATETKNHMVLLATLHKTIAELFSAAEKEDNKLEKLQLEREKVGFLFAKSITLDRVFMSWEAGVWRVRVKSNRGDLGRFYGLASKQEALEFAKMMNRCLRISDGLSGDVYDICSKGGKITLRMEDNPTVCGTVLSRQEVLEFAEHTNA